MSYVVYADIILLYNICINFLLYSLITILHRQRIKLFCLIIWSCCTGILSFGIFILCLHTNLPYILIYATSYFFMTYLFIKSLIVSCSRLYSLSIFFISMLLLSGFMNLCFHRHILFKKYFGFFLLSVTILKFVSFFIKNKPSSLANANIFSIEIYSNDNHKKATGYLDTGNMLYNPYNHNPVIILNPITAIKLLPNATQAYIDEYRKTGNFPYDAYINEIHLFPLPYKTISSSFALMPAFRVDKLVFSESKKTYTNITAAISRKTFMDKNNYQVLLHESLKP